MLKAGYTTFKLLEKYKSPSSSSANAMDVCGSSKGMKADRSDEDDSEDGRHRRVDRTDRLWKSAARPLSGVSGNGVS